MKTSKHEKISHPQQRMKFKIKKCSELLLLGSILIASISTPGCKKNKTVNQLADSNAPSSSCDIDTITMKLNELNSSEADLVLAQHLKYAIQTAGPCTTPKMNCESKCNSDYSGFRAYWYQKVHGLCLDGCLATFQLCMKVNSGAVANGQREPVDPVNALASRVTLLQRREEILYGLHLCSTDADAARVMSQQINSYVGSRDQELGLEGEVWKNLWNSDRLVSLTYRYTRGTAIDVPARRGYLTRASWQKGYENQSFFIYAGYRVLEGVIQEVTPFAENIRSAIGADDSIDISIDDQYIDKIVQGCRNVTDTCTAISCLGHRTQEIMSVRDNIDNLGTKALTRDGREFPLCRHYAPTYEKACNQWAKEHGLADTMNCTREERLSMNHEFPIVTLQFEGKSYQYIYDLMNDPMTPDLVPNNTAAEESVSVPCPSTKRPQESGLRE